MRSICLSVALGLVSALTTLNVAAAPAEDTSVAALVSEAADSAEVAQKPVSPDDAMNQVDEALRAYMRRMGAPEDGGVANKGGVSVQFSRGTASAVVPPGSAGFSDARNLAFERAFQNALGEIAQSRGRRITTQVMSQLMQDTTNAAEFVEACKPDAAEAMVMKMKQLALAGMDAALRKLDVPADDIQTQRPSFRCENPQFLDAINTGTRTTALASLRGVRIVKSVAVGQEVGVVVAVSPNFVAGAEAMARGEVARKPLATAVEEITTELQSLEPVQLIGEYGTRAAKLSNGEMAVFAFGQAGANLTANEVGAIRSGKRRAAQSAATRAAESQLAQYSKVTTYFVASDKRGASAAQESITTDGVPTEEQTAQVGRQLMEEINSTAELRLEGAQVVKRWWVEDPDSGDMIEGIVLAWSPSLAANMQAASKPTGANAQPSRAQTGSARKLESADRKEDW